MVGHGAWVRLGHDGFNRREYGIEILSASLDRVPELQDRPCLSIGMRAGLNDRQHPLEKLAKPPHALLDVQQEAGVRVFAIVWSERGRGLWGTTRGLRRNRRFGRDAGLLSNSVRMRR
jgi:hypothetical protein